MDEHLLWIMIKHLPSSAGFAAEKKSRHTKDFHDLPKIEKQDRKGCSSVMLKDHIVLYRVLLIPLPFFISIP